MKRFQFSLEPLLTLRRHKETMAREAYARALQACEAAAARLESASLELTRCWRAVNETLEAGAMGLELLRARAWCNVLELRVKERASALEEARHAVDAVWQNLVVATRDREMLQRLREKREHLHAEENQRAEQKVSDDLAIQIAGSCTLLRPPASLVQSL